MRVVKINKSFRNGNKKHFLVLLNEVCSNDDIDSFVEEWCESEPSGMNYGYTYEWLFVEDTINMVLINKLKIINNKINSLKIGENKIGNYLKQINKK